MAEDRHEQERQHIAGMILRRVEGSPSATPEQEHLDEETLAIFSAGEVQDAGERNRIIEHLSRCSVCRQTVSLLVVQDVGDLPGLPPKPQAKSWSRTWLGALSLAASVLLVLGFGTVAALWLRDSGPTEAEVYARALRALEAGQFAEAREMVRDASKFGVQSDRLRNIEAQADRGLPGPSAFALAGRITDFGIGLGGIEARSADPRSEAVQLRAAEVLAEITRPDALILLNRGHALLSVGETEKAAHEFEQAAALASNDPMVDMALGLARFQAKDYQAAEHSFQAALSKDSSLVAARFNLAATLEELGRYDDALNTWEKVLASPLQADDRQRIERHVEDVRKGVDPKP